MGRIVRDIEIEGRKARALFDSGSLRSYIRAEVRPSLSWRVVPVTVGLGGDVKILDEQCAVNGKIEGLDFSMTAYVVKEIGETEFGTLDAIVGALTMEEWYIKLDPKAGELDLTGLRRREFQEFIGRNPA